MIKISQHVERNLFNDFHSILKKTGGRYSFNPLIGDRSVTIGYFFDKIEDYNKFNERWNKLFIKIEEKNSAQWWRKILRRIKLFFSNILK